MPNPITSILIPAYNHEKYITDLIESIWSHGLTDYEIVLVDDGSQDSTNKVAQNLANRSPVNMRVFSRPNKGLVRTLNELVGLAKGDFVYFIASDDIVAPGGLSAAIKNLCENENYMMIMGNGRSFRTNEKLEEVLYGERMRCTLKAGRNATLEYLYSNISNILIQTCIYRKNFIVGINGFDEDAMLDDWPFQIKTFQSLKDDSNWRFMEECVVHYRRHDTNISRNIDKQYLQITDTVNRYIPEENRNKLLSSAYVNLAKVAIFKSPMKGLSLFIESQKKYFSIINFVKFPYDVASVLFKYLCNKIGHGS